MAYPRRQQSAAGISWLRKCEKLMLDGLYPCHCRSCEVPLCSPLNSDDLEAWLCSSCQQSLEPIIPPVCSVCGEPYDGAMTSEFLFWNCEGRKVAFDFAISAYKARGVLRELIHGFK
jgi:predicted amidophosphoribosyltransferase